jgi:peptidoglycan hydrolase CwlO-like protein
MFGYRELEAKLREINTKLDNIQNSVNECLQNTKENNDEMQQQISNMYTVVLEIQNKFPEIIEQPNEDSPFKTKEGLYNYKYRKQILKE